ncbi:hypothetical protein A671_03959 [Salmonella enterica subsp. enterica serovar Dublin str. DG22]|nr:hypothetical protein A671_03959 [Salmonella enterica subsp. enterica serovar Dublin str. DG22]
MTVATTAHSALQSVRFQDRLPFIAGDYVATRPSEAHSGLYLLSFMVAVTN